MCYVAQVSVTGPSWPSCFKVICYYSSVDWGVVGCGKGDGYLTSLGRPTDIGFQLDKACYPFSRQG